MDKVSRVHAPNVGGTPTRRPPNEYALLPAEAPLPMPRQSLRPESTGNVVRDRLSAPRAILILLTLSATATFAFVLYQILSVVRLTPLQAVFLVLCTLCFAWIALGTASALLGFFASLRWEAGGLWRTPVERGGVAATSHRSSLARLSRGCRPRCRHHRGHGHRTHRAWPSGGIRLLCAERQQNARSQSP
jgi:hypothetical protein